MKFAIIGGNSRWSKILIKNFKYFNLKPTFTSSRYITSSINITDFRNIPLKKIDFVVVCSDIKRNFLAASFFLKNKKPIFIEKPIAASQKNYLYLDKLAKKNKTILFCNYQHIYASPLQFIKKRILNKEKVTNISINFGKNGPIKNINSSYEWLPHSLSILFFIINKNNKFSLKFEDYISKKKTNIIIESNSPYKIKNLINIKAGNNFKKKTYLVNISTNKNLYIYDANKPNQLLINNKVKIFKNYPLYNSILCFLKILNKRKSNNINLRFNSKISKKIMLFLNNYNL